MSKDLISGGLVPMPQLPKDYDLGYLPYQGEMPNPQEFRSVDVQMPQLPMGGMYAPSGGIGGRDTPTGGSPQGGLVQGAAGYTTGQLDGLAGRLPERDKMSRIPESWMRSLGVASIVGVPLAGLASIAGRIYNTIADNVNGELATKNYNAPVHDNVGYGVTDNDENAGNIRDAYGLTGNPEGGDRSSGVGGRDAGDGSQGPDHGAGNPGK